VRIHWGTSIENTDAVDDIDDAPSACRRERRVGEHLFFPVRPLSTDTTPDSAVC
jgi:hypothetical protein